MATLRNRNGKWQAQVRRNGHSPRTKSFSSKRDAERWARQTEAELDATAFACDPRVLERKPYGTCLHATGRRSQYRNVATLPNTSGLMAS